MKKISLCVFALSFAMLAPAFALPQADEDIHTGNDLIEACDALLSHNTSDRGVLASTACRHFLGAMVLKVYKATPAGMPTEFSRIGPNGDETACFRLPDSLRYGAFAEYIAEYFSTHPELGSRPAFELGARTLAAKYPCSQ